MNNLGKRISLGVLLGLLFGLLCFKGFTMNPNVAAGMVSLQEWSWSNPMMWNIVVNRMVVGFVVAIAGFITIHPFFNFRIPTILRGAKFGALVSILLAIGVFMGPESDVWGTFWIIVGAGAVIGAIIDLIITRVAGEGKSLIIKK